MSDLNQKVPFAQSLNVLASNVVSQAIENLGQALPCTVVSMNQGLVTVNFTVNSQFTLPQVTIPIAMSQYLRIPVAAGDTGMCIAADALLAGITGQNNETPDLTPPTNLSALAFVPLTNVNWSAVFDSVTYIMSLVEIDLDAPNVVVTQNMTVGSGISGSFTTGTGQIVTVQGGIITNIFGNP